jgi:hypothetical protein
LRLEFEKLTRVSKVMNLGFSDFLSEGAGGSIPADLIVLDCVAKHRIVQHLTQPFKLPRQLTPALFGWSLHSLALLALGTVVQELKAFPAERHLPCFVRDAEEFLPGG